MDYNPNYFLIKIDKSLNLPLSLQGKKCLGDLVVMQN